MKKLIVLFLLLTTIIYAQIGRRFIVGYTSYDWQFNGPVYTWCRTDPIANGVHLYWMWSNFVPSTDRNQRYNFYDCTNHILNWVDGVNVFTERSGFGNLDCDPQTGWAVMSTQQGATGTIRPLVASDQVGGSQGPIGFGWPPITVSFNRAIHCAMIDCTSQDSLWYSRIQPWPSWTTPMKVCPPAPDPMFPCHNIAASKISNKVVILWTCPEIPGQEPAYYRLSNDGGISWQPPTQLTFPPQETTPSFHISSLFAMFDNQDNLHIVASVCDTGYSHGLPAGIWHWCPINNPQWSCIYFYNPETIPITPNCGYNAIFATRPSIVQASNSGYLYVAWEQFDNINYELLTGLSRADVWIAESPNNGLTWQNQQPITTPNTTSKRYPCVGGVDHDTLSIAYLIDSIAGFENYTQGRATRNPIVLHRIKVPLPASIIEEQSTLYAQRSLLNAEPNPFTSHTVIRYSLPINSKTSLEIYDVTGRLVKTLVSRKKSACE